MSNLLALTWRCLLALALVLNPVAGASMAFAAAPAPASGSTETAAITKMPPCHAMAAQHAEAAQQHDKSAPEREHGCGCGNAACEFGACCGLAALNVPTVLFAFVPGAQSLPTRDLPASAAPPPARMIRPPIA